MDEHTEPHTQGQELRSFLFLSVVMAPVLAVIVVAGYGFLVWMFQLLVSGPPGSKVVNGSALSAQELHIASLVVHSTPRRLSAVAQAVTTLPGAVVHTSSPNGKLVVTLEAPSADAMTQAVLTVQRIDGVLSAALVYQCSDSLDAMNEEISNA